MDRTMLYNASPQIFAYAQQLRNKLTPAEKMLWERMKENALGVRFKPQLPIDIFIADFYCHALKMIIEIDGEYHNFQIEKDNARTKDIENLGTKIIRFTNEEVQSNIEIVLSKIKSEIEFLKKGNQFKRAIK